MAIGNPFDNPHSVSVGVVSGLGRPLEIVERRNVSMIQTDAAINPGNSGGPLLNLRGEVIGINTAIYTDSQQQGNIGIGFAVPINLVRDLLPQLRTGKVTRGRIGVGVRNVRYHEFDEMGLENQDGAVIPEVFADGAAEEAGLAVGDVVIAYDGRPVRRSEDLVSMVTATPPDTTVPMRIVRDGREQTLTITVDELDPEAERNLAGGSAPIAPLPEPEPSRGFGLELGSVTPGLQQKLRLNDTNGALVTEVVRYSAAHRAGLLLDDVIVRVGSRRITTAREANEALLQIPTGGTALLWVVRGGSEIFVSVRKD
jgi:serine protease Do